MNVIAPKRTDCICIYCGKDESETEFGTREHVIPELLGSFDNNPTLIGWVCNHCNSSIFSPLEVRFKEDTEEGISCQMMNFHESSEIRVRNNNLKFSVDLGLGDSFFNDAFPFLTHTDKGWKVHFVPQIRVKGYSKTGFIILLIDKVKVLPREGKKFRKIKNILANFESKDVSIFTHGEDESQREDLDAAMDLVRELGIDYKPGTEKHMPFVGDGTDERKANISVEGTIGSDTGRVLAKIAFNYFAYSAVASGEESFLYHKNFDRIKSYILGEVELPIKDIIIEKPTYNPLTFDEASRGSRLVGHMVTLSAENGNLISRVSFGGRLVYKILLGKLPPELSRPNFGSGHMFEPFQKVIIGMTQNPTKWGMDMPLNFGLFNNG